jgi:hypothetical protein
MQVSIGLEWYGYVTSRFVDPLISLFLSSYVFLFCFFISLSSDRIFFYYASSLPSVVSIRALALSVPIGHGLAFSNGAEPRRKKGQSKV